MVGNPFDGLVACWSVVCCSVLCCFVCLWDFILFFCDFVGWWSVGLAGCWAVENPTIDEYAAITQTQLSSSAGILPFRRMGIASGGDSFGFMLEFLFPANSEIIDNPFASNRIIDSTIYDSTYNDRGGSVPSKVSMPGGITRLSWTYSF